MATKKGGDDGRNRRLSLVGSASRSGAPDAKGMQDLSIGDGQPQPDPRQAVVLDSLYGMRFASLSQAGHEPDGVKKVNQDSFIAIPDISRDGKAGACFGVFDGHGSVGHHVSQFIIGRMPSTIQVAKLVKDNSAKCTQKVLEESFKTLNTQLEKQKEIDCALSGTTAVSCIVRNGAIACCNLGDSRCIVARKSGGDFKCVELSIDQKPERADERKRVQKAGGRVEPLMDETGEPIGPSRVWLKHMMLPGLAMTRSFGDQVAASVGVCAEPETIVHQMSPDDSFMILASDGVWEFITNEESIALVKDCATPDEAARKLVDESSARWREEEEVMDDITAMVVFFEGYKH